MFFLYIISILIFIGNYFMLNKNCMISIPSYENYNSSLLLGGPSVQLKILDVFK